MQIFAGADALEEPSTGGPDHIARSMLKNLLLPRYLSRSYISKLLRRSIRNGSWRFLSPFQRSLLLVCSRICRRVRSEALYNALSEIAIDIELHSTRGRALYYGLIMLLRKARSVEDASSIMYREVEHILYRGVSYINNPSTYRAMV